MCDVTVCVCMRVCVFVSVCMRNSHWSYGNCCVAVAVVGAVDADVFHLRTCMIYCIACYYYYCSYMRCEIRNDCIYG